MRRDSLFYKTLLVLYSYSICSSVAINCLACSKCDCTTNIKGIICSNNSCIEGKGSIFNFGIMFQLGSQEENREPHIPHRLDSSSKTVLIVDDNKINRIVTKRVLEKQQIVCSEAGGGYEAIDILRKENYDLVLMDVNMPEIDGLETTKKIRSFNADIPIIALTAVELDEIVEKIINAGMQDIIVKPYDQNLFYNTIYKYLLNKKAS